MESNEWNMYMTAALMLTIGNNKAMVQRSSYGLELDRLALFDRIIA